MRRALAGAAELSDAPKVLLRPDFVLASRLRISRRFVDIQSFHADDFPEQVTAFGIVLPRACITTRVIALPGAQQHVRIEGPHAGNP